MHEAHINPIADVKLEAALEAEVVEMEKLSVANQRRLADLWRSFGDEGARWLKTDGVTDLSVGEGGQMLVGIGDKMIDAGYRLSQSDVLRVIKNAAKLGRSDNDDGHVSVDLPTGERFESMGPPTTSEWMFTVRKPNHEELTLEMYRDRDQLSWEFYDLIRAGSESRANFLIVGAAFAGKAQPLDSMILTPTGFVPMGSIRVGDMLRAPDGSVTRVNGVFPQGEMKVYRITFHDGRTAECTGNHLWKVWGQINTRHPDGRKKRKDAWRVEEFDTIRKWFSKGDRRSRRISFPTMDFCAADLPPVDLPIDPYVIGVLIGDGGLTRGTPILSNPDADIVTSVETRLGDITARPVPGSSCDFRLVMTTRRKANRLSEALESLGLKGKRSYEKFIPTVCLRGSASQRLALLQGLMDTDGTAGKFGAATYSTSSEQLAKDVQYLIRSLGGWAKITRKEKTYTYNGECKQGRTCHEVSMRIPDMTQLFTLSRKVERCIANPSRPRDRLRIKAIEEVGMKECQCISVEHPDHLYVTDNFVVTHNTSLLKAMVRQPCFTTERCFFIEQTPEVPRLDKRWIMTKTRPIGRYTAGELVIKSLRHRVDRTFLGEMRGGETLDWLDTCNLGRSGGGGTIHAPSAQRGLRRVDQLVTKVTEAPQRDTIIETIDMIIVVRPHPALGRIISEVSKPVDYSDGKFQVEPFTI